MLQHSGGLRRRARPRGGAEGAPAGPGSVRDAAFGLVLLQLRVDAIGAAMPDGSDPLDRRAAELRLELAIPRDGWAIDGGARRLGLDRRAPGGGWALLAGSLRDRIDADEGSRASAARQLEALRGTHPGLDEALVLAVAMREAGPSAVSASGAEVHSFHAGGLDHLGRERHALRLPEGYGARWCPEDAGEVNHRGRPRLAATLPRDEVIVAYGAVLARREALFERRVAEVFGDRADALLSGLGRRARRAWIQIAFAGPNGRAFDPAARHAEGFGARTALEALRHEIAAGRARGLDDVLHNERLRGYLSVRRGVVTAAEAELLEAAGVARRADG